MLPPKLVFYLEVVCFYHVSVIIEGNRFILVFHSNQRGIKYMKSIRIALLLVGFWSLQVAGVQAAILDEVKFHVENFYYGTQPPNLKTLTSIEQIESKLDGFSEYLTFEEYQTLKASIENPSTAAPRVANTSLSVLPNVSSKMLYGGVGYIRLHSFSLDAKSKIETEWKTLQSQGATQLIFDLRYNGGGYVDSSVQLLGMFKNVPYAYNMLSRAGTKLIPVTPARIQFPNNPSILINSYSASAAEMVAVAVKDSKSGTLYGQQTFGKGSVQAFYELSDGGALKLTTSHFEGPKGTLVNKVGIKPDIQVIAGKEIAAAHYDQIDRQLSMKRYLKTTTLEQVPTNKTFTIKFSQPMKFTEGQTQPRIELVKMGGKSQPISWAIKDEYSLVTTPTQLLEKNETYLLIVHPQFSNQKGVGMIKGSYTMVTVKPN